MRILLAIIALLLALPSAAQAAAILINNGLDCSNPGNVIDDDTHLGDTVYVRNVGCGTPDPGSPCPSPGDPTEVCVADGGAVGLLDTRDSSVVTISGGYVGLFVNSRVYNFATVTITGGQLVGLDAYDSSIVTISGGNFGHLYAYDSCTVTMSGGLGTLHTRDSSVVTESGGAAQVDAGGSSIVAITGSEEIFLEARDSSTVTISGGTTLDAVLAYDSSTVTIAGRDFAVDGSPVSYGDLAAQSGTLTGVLTSGDTIDGVFAQGGGGYTGTITLVFGLNVPALPKWGYAALAGGLIVVGTVVMRRRRAA